MRVELPEGQWAEVADVETLRDGDRKAVNRAISVSADAEGHPVLGGDYDDKMTDALLVRICTNWSLPFPPPDQDPASLDKLTIQQARVLHEGIAEHMALVKDEADPTAGNVSSS
jgi:hypothetical protein